MNMIKKIVGMVAMAVVLFLSTTPVISLAQDTNTRGGTTVPDPSRSGYTAPPSAFGKIEKLDNPVKYDTFSELAEAVIKTAVEVLTPFLVMAIIYAGFLFVKAQGNETEITKAKGILLYTVIGAAILMGAWGFAQIIGNTISTITQ